MQWTSVAGERVECTKSSLQQSTALHFFPVLISRVVDFQINGCLTSDMDKVLGFNSWPQQKCFLVHFQHPLCDVFRLMIMVDLPTSGLPKIFQLWPSHWLLFILSCCWSQRGVQQSVSPDDGNCYCCCSSHHLNAANIVHLHTVRLSVAWYAKVCDSDSLCIFRNLRNWEWRW